MRETHRCFLLLAVILNWDRRRVDTRDFPWRADKCLTLVGAKDTFWYM